VEEIAFPRAFFAPAALIRTSLPCRRLFKSFYRDVVVGVDADAGGDAERLLGDLLGGEVGVSA
jgi:hypothetical protein